MLLEHVEGFRGFFHGKFFFVTNLEGGRRGVFRSIHVRGKGISFFFSLLDGF